jgi:hypothetical protein
VACHASAKRGELDRRQEPIVCPTQVEKLKLRMDKLP